MDGVCDELEIQGCMDPEACNYNPEATDAGFCYSPAPYYNCDGECINDVDDDGVCDEQEIEGCDDQDACNFDPEATENDGSCIYPEEYLDCEGNCLNDVDEDGICDETETLGCTDQSACNFDSLATLEDSSCDYESCLGCTDAEACNYDETSTIDDGSCDYESCAGCTDQLACNFDETATSDDGSCEYESCYGCTDEEALNYDSEAEFDDGSCIYECEFPMMDFMVYCEDNDFEHFYVDLTVMTGGNVMPLEISNTANSGVVEIMTPGMYEMGAFDNGENVKFYASCPDLGCQYESDNYTMMCMPQHVEEFTSNSFDIYPNPNTGQFQVSLNQSIVNGVLEVLDARGRLVHAERFTADAKSQYAVEMNANLETGLYILRLTSDGQSASKRMLIH